MRYFLLIILMFSFSCAYGLDYAKDGFPPLQSNSVLNGGINLSEIEQFVLGATYAKQCTGIRLNRLEKAIFKKTFPRLSIEDRIKNLSANYKNFNPEFRGLSAWERKIFNRSFEYDTSENRISRLEERVIGSIQSGDLYSRYDKLVKIIPEYKNVTTFSPYYCTPIVQSGGGWRGLANSLTNFFTGSYVGYPTGISPQIYSPYVNNYGPDYQRGFYNGQAWNYHNSYNGYAPASVRILH